jgi:hypothetical protein
MSIGFLGNIELEIGYSRFHSTPVHVAPLREDMLLGLDFLQDNGVTLKCGPGGFHIAHGDVSYPMHKPREDPSFSVVFVRGISVLSESVSECALTSRIS